MGKQELKNMYALPQSTAMFRGPIRTMCQLCKIKSSLLDKICMIVGVGVRQNL